LKQRSKYREDSLGDVRKKNIGKCLRLSSKYRENCPTDTDGTVFRTDQQTTTSHEMKFRKSETVCLSVCHSPTSLVFFTYYLQTG